MIICQECGEKMIIDRSKQLLSDPPKYICNCPKCGNVQYEYCSTCDRDTDDLKEYIINEQILW